MNISENFVPFELAKQLKGLGFNEPCLQYYNNRNKTMYSAGTIPKEDIHRDILCPLWQQLESWLWQEHKIWIETEVVDYGDNFFSEEFYSCIMEMNANSMIDITVKFNSPITAKQSGITAAINYLIEKL